MEITINGKQFQAKIGETILTVLQRNGINIPTLCFLKQFSPTGACRMCVVEISGNQNLVTACSYTLTQSIEVFTHSPKVLKARKNILELLLASHPDDCLYCLRNGSCELQHLSAQLGVTERKIHTTKARIGLDKTSPSIVLDRSKCVLCGRCIKICEEVVSCSTLNVAKRGKNTILTTTLDKPLNNSNCIFCGQCVLQCPTGALTEKNQSEGLDEILSQPNKIAIAHISPEMGISISQVFGIKNIKEATGLIIAALRKAGFRYIFDTSAGIDVMTHLMALELKESIKNQSGTVFSSHCPSWVKYAEQYFPNYLHHLSKIKSGHQIMPGLIKQWFSKNQDIAPEQMYVVSFSSCLSRKYESQQIISKQINNDRTLSTREFIRFLQIHGIEITQLKPEEADVPFQFQTTSSKLSTMNGGLAEVLAREFIRLETKNDPEAKVLSDLKSNKNIKSFTITINNEPFLFMSANGIPAATEILNDIENKKINPVFVEVTVCPDGCINGGGQPLFTTEEQIKTRIKNIIDTDEKEMFRIPSKNPICPLISELTHNPDTNSIFFNQGFTKRDVLL